MLRLSPLLFAAAIACGSPTHEDGAVLALQVTLKSPDLRAYAADVTEEALAKLLPQKIQVLVCDYVKLDEQSSVYCSAENKASYNHIAVIENVQLSVRTEERIDNIPPARDQVILVQGLAADGKITYEGAERMPIIEPSVVTRVSVELEQTEFPILPPPLPPTITKPAATPFTTTAGLPFRFEGTREAGTVLKVSSPSLSGMTTPLYLSSDTGIYKEKTSGAVTTWTLDVLDLPPNTTGDKRNIGAFKFSVARLNEDRYSAEVSYVMWACTAGVTNCTP